MKIKNLSSKMKRMYLTSIGLIVTTLPVFAEKETLLDKFINTTSDYFTGITGIFLFISIISIGVGIILNRKNAEKREEEMNGLVYFAFGAGIIILAGVIVTAIL